MARHQSGDLVEAARLYKVVLRKYPDNFDALHLLGLVEAQRGQLEKGERLIGQAVKANPASPEAFSNLGNVQHQRGRLEPALASYDQALRLNSRYPTALNNRGSVLLALDRPAEAVASFEAALAVEPRFAGALYNRGIAQRALGQPGAALASFDEAAALQPDAAPIHTDRGTILVEMRRLEEALAAFDKALSIDPSFADAHYNRAVALLHQQRLEEALKSLDSAVALKPAFATALGNRGNVLLQLGRLEEALASFDRALEADPTYLSALADRGHAAFSAGRYEDAAASFARLRERNPDFPFALGNQLISKMYCCDWQGFDALNASMMQGLHSGKAIVLPGHLLSLSDSPRDQLQAAQTWVKELRPAGPQPRPPRAYRHDKIRLAYVSANFNDHPVATALVGLFEGHDRSRFETFAFSLGPDDGGDMRKRLTRAFDHFTDVRNMTDDAVAGLLEAQEIDIAIDLMGFTDGARPGIFIRRPADIQASYLGFPGTMALDAIDYILADARVIPESERAWYSERIVSLPDSYFVNDASRPISERAPTRTQAGFPENGVVFCCFNNQYKITPEVFAVWMRLLGSVEGSVLWLRNPHSAAVRNLRQAAQDHGIAPERLVFADRVQSPADHLARQRLADLFLDTFPYTAHSTACDALWAGLPVLTRIGSAFPARVAASLLTAARLPELITTSLSDYEAVALRLAHDGTALADLKAKLARNRSTCALFDADRSRRNIERALLTMWERHQRGEAPASFAVENATA